MTFDGFKSRCTMPSACTSASASAIWVASATACAIGIGPRRRIASSVSPSTFCMTT
jgi:hypothetical protein